MSGMFSHWEDSVQKAVDYRWMIKAEYYAPSRGSKHWVSVHKLNVSVPVDISNCEPANVLVAKAAHFESGLNSEVFS